jgi:hypothetical protein
MKVARESAPRRRTMRERMAALLLLASASLAGCAEEPQTNPATRAPAAVAVGDEVDCISTNLIANTEVHDDRTIDFVMRGGTIYRNTLPVACSSLGFEERFAYRTTIGRLCSVDTITVLQSGGINGPTCGLGKFVPVRLVKE